MQTAFDPMGQESKILFLQDVAGIPVEEQVLAYRNSLDDHASLLEHGITANAVINLTGRLR
jgi:hypothetical protein